jgi:hypothetical protein
MYNIKAACGEGIGGAVRYGRACVVVEDPENNFSKRGVKKMKRLK